MNPPPGPAQVLHQGAIVYERPDGIRVEFWTREQGITALTKALAANNKPIGDPQEEIDLFLQKSKIPYSTPIPIITTHSVPEKNRLLIERVNSWLGNKYDQRDKNILVFVNPEEAKRRAAICFACPYNIQWRDSCRSCRAEMKDAIERNEITISGNRRTHFHDRLFACKLAGHSNKVAVQLGADNLKHREHYKLPQKCWMNRL